MRASHGFRDFTAVLIAAGGAALLTWLLRRSPLAGHAAGLALVLLLFVLAACLSRRLAAGLAAAVTAAGGYGIALGPLGKEHGIATVWLLAAMLAAVGCTEIWRHRERDCETALLGMERRYRRMFEHNLAGVYRSTPEGEILDCNEACARMFGFPGRSQLLGRRLDELCVDGESREALARALREQGHFAHREGRYRRQDGGTLWVLESASLLPTGPREQRVMGSPAAFAHAGAIVEGAMLDITARRQSEEALRARERRFHALIENSSDAIALLSPEGDILYASDSSLRVVGHAPAELVSRPLQELLHPEDRPTMTALWSQVLRRPGTSAAVQLRWHHRDGSWRWTEGTVTNLVREPAVAALVLNYRDVGERRALEEQLRQSQKMEAMGRLAGGIAHDFNNLLTIITGYSEIALLHAADEPLRKQLSEIKRAGERAAGLTRQLLAFSRHQALVPQLVDLNAMVRGMEQMLRPLIGEQIEVDTHLAGGRLMVRADPGQIEQVILNLAVNARDAMPKGGQLALITSQVEVPEGAASGGPPPGRYVLLCVRDNGTGIGKELQARIFEPFFTTKERGKGTGLGLAMVYGIMRQSGGHIELQSETGRGSSFFLYFPRAESAAGATTARAQPAPAAAGYETILLAEDEDGVRVLVRDALRAKGYEVIECRDGREALRVSSEHAGRIDLLLTDVVMPHLDGRRLAEKLRAVHPETKVLFMSGYAEPLLDGDASTAHASAPLLQKPFPPESLPIRVRQALDAESV